MTFRPAVPMTGVAGWAFLTRTMDAQKAAMQRAPVLQREMDHFRENIGNVSTPEQLVGDFTLLKVALGAFGLQDDISNRFFVRKVLAEGTFDPGSLANRLGDPRYAAMSRAFGFGSEAPPRTGLSGFADEILSAYADQSFEVAVGNAQPDLRLALGLERELTRVLESAASPTARWFGLMGSPPLRQIFETALGLPDSFAALDIDQQLSVFRERSDAMFGTSDLGAFAEPALQDALRDRFLLLGEIQNGAGPAQPSPVLSLLNGVSGPPGASAILTTLYGA